ncbi:NAD/NADP octopine/nopaline dehydrogenase family protein [[Clostridium] innocuum]|uniref:NAD/NADP octopine/nopaline dehydrogenase family protein n=1 Tax=Clostridium innocuum TaxID=1522 RepID=UPI0032575047
MKVAVVGAGNGGCAIAADMAHRGLDVTLIKTSNAIHDDNFTFLQNNGGKMVLKDFGTAGSMNPDELEIVDKVGIISKVTRDLSVLSSMDIVIIYVQTNFHETIIERIAKFLVDGQIILINPGYLSTTYILKYCGEKDITIVEAQSSFIDGRIMEPGLFKVGFRNVRNPLGVFPSKKIAYAKGKLDKLGFPFHYMDNVIEAALHNPNLIVHTVGSIMSIPMIDSMKENFCMYHYAFTEHTWNVLEKLDSEKMDILEKLGCERLPYVEACKFRNSLDNKKDAKDVFFDYAAMPTRAKGPVNVNSRYITEDVPQGLVMLESLGKSLDVSTPVTTALIEIASAALDRDFRKDGRTPERLGVENIQRVLNDK